MNKPKLVLTIGLPGSGKSGFVDHMARRDGYFVVRHDDLVDMNAGIYRSEHKSIYHDAEAAMIKSAIEAGNSVIVDRTHTRRKARQRVLEMFKPGEVEVEYWEFNTQLSVCLERRMRSPRGFSIQRWGKIINDMLSTFESPYHDKFGHEIKRLTICSVDGIVPYRFRAIDFDGTIVKNAFPKIGYTLPGALEQLQQWWDNDKFNVNIIWTCRAGDEYNQVLNIIKDEEWAVDFVNENPLVSFTNSSRKIFAHEYIDDHNETIPWITGGKSVRVTNTVSSQELDTVKS